VYLGFKDIYSIFKGMLYNLFFIFHKLLFNALTYYFSFKKVFFMFFMKLVLRIKYPRQELSAAEPSFLHWFLKVHTVGLFATS